jgi:hypothetical protein
MWSNTKYILVIIIIISRTCFSSVLVAKCVIVFALIILWLSLKCQCFWQMRYWENCLYIVACRSWYKCNNVSVTYFLFWVCFNMYFNIVLYNYFQIRDYFKSIVNALGLKWRNDSSLQCRMLFVFLHYIYFNINIEWKVMNMEEKWKETWNLTVGNALICSIWRSCLLLWLRIVYMRFSFSFSELKCNIKGNVKLIMC